MTRPMSLLNTRTLKWPFAAFLKQSASRTGKRHQSVPSTCANAVQRSLDTLFTDQLLVLDVEFASVADMECTAIEANVYDRQEGMVAL